MTWRAPLWKAIMDRAKTDTGSGGIYESDGTNLVTGFYNVWLPTDQTFPAVVYQIASAFDVDDFTAKVIELDIRMHVFAKMVPVDGDTPGGDLIAAIVDRINGDWLLQSNGAPTYGFDRWKPTISGWDTDMMVHSDSNENHELENGILHQIESFDMVLSKQGA